MMNASQSLYSRIGGEPVLHEFVDNLYRFMEDFPPVEKIRKMHPDDLTDTRDRLFKFLSGMLGGPPLYLAEFGQPYLRQKHMHLVIDDQERDQWLFCAENSANQLKIDIALRKELMSKMTETANHLHNQNEMLSRANGWQSAGRC
jgi:hemoglobin